MKAWGEQNLFEGLKRRECEFSCAKCGLKMAVVIFERTNAREIVAELDRKHFRQSARCADRNGVRCIRLMAAEPGRRLAKGVGAASIIRPADGRHRQLVALAKELIRGS